MTTTDWNQVFSSNEEVIYTMFAVMGMFLIFVLAISLILLVLKVVGRWKMFEKAGEAGWKAIIPIYNTYTQCKIVGISAYWIFIIFIGYLIGSFIIAIKLITHIAVVYFSVMIAMSTARSFGKSDSIGIGLFLLPSVFNMIIGCDSSKYEGKRPFGDVLLPMDADTNSTSVKSASKSSSVVKGSSKKKTTTKKAEKKPAAKKSTTSKKTTKKPATKKTTTTKKAPAKKNGTTRKTTTKKSTKK